MKEIRLILTGFGVIGRGVAETIIHKRASLKKKGVNLRSYLRNLHPEDTVVRLEKTSMVFPFGGTLPE